jgi:acyl carrier protein
MTAQPITNALELVRETLCRFTEVPASEIQMASRLEDIQIDSLTLAELLFELEDKLKVNMPDTEKLPQTVAEIVELITPFLSEQKG